MSKRYQYFSYSLLTATLIFLIPIQKNLSEFRKNNFSANPLATSYSPDDITYIPLQPLFIRLSSPADPSFMSDLIWMRTCYYFGTHVLTDKQYPYLAHLLDMVTDLSPKWKLPYYYGAALLPIDVTSASEGIYIIEKGIQQFTDDWRLWFFKGYYQWKFFNDPIQAAETLRKSSLLPEAPLYLSNLPASIATKAGQKELAIRFLQESLKEAKDEQQKQVLIRKLEEVLRGE